MMNKSNYLSYLLFFPCLIPYFLLIFKFKYRDARKKEKMLKEIEDKKMVRAYEESKAKGSIKF